MAKPYFPSTMSDIRSDSVLDNKANLSTLPTFEKAPVRLDRDLVERVRH
jgi:hypothetical protein